MEDNMMYYVFTGPYKVMKIVLIIFLVLALTFAFWLIFVETLIQVETSRALSSAKLSYDSGYYEPIEKNLIRGNTLRVEGLTMDEQPITKDNFPRYGDLMKVKVTTTKPSYNIFKPEIKTFYYTTTLVNRGTFGEGYKYERGKVKKDEE